MTPKQKIKILRGMYKELQYYRWAGIPIGFCFAYESLFPNIIVPTERKIISLGLKRPAKSYGLFWYRPNDTATRLRLITRLINKLTKQKKP